jgi:putative transposase
MANTYTQIHVQIIFAVKYREALINPAWKNELYRFMTGIVQSNGHKLLSINGVADHVHILIGLRPTQGLSELVQQIKRSSAMWINDKKIVRGRFAWQEGFGAFSYAMDALASVIRYIENQEIHHQKRSFREEYIQILKESRIEFDERYLFTQV